MSSKLANAGGMEQTTIHIEYTYIDRLIQWGQTNMPELIVFGILVAVIVFIWRRK